MQLKQPMYGIFLKNNKQRREKDKSVQLLVLTSYSCLERIGRSIGLLFIDLFNLFLPIYVLPTIYVYKPLYPNYGFPGIKRLPANYLAESQKKVRKIPFYFVM